MMHAVRPVLQDGFSCGFFFGGCSFLLHPGLHTRIKPLVCPLHKCRMRIPVKRLILHLFFAMCSSHNMFHTSIRKAKQCRFCRAGPDRHVKLSPFFTYSLDHSPCRMPGRAFGTCILRRIYLPLRQAAEDSRFRKPETLLRHQLSVC